MSHSPSIGRPMSTDHKSLIRTIPIFLIGIALIYLYYPTLVYLFHVWSDDKEYSHGFLVPLVSIYFIWLSRDALSAIEIRPARVLGFIPILFSFLILAAGESGGVPLLSAISLLLVLPGVVLYLVGSRCLKVLMFPLAYLLFMIPWMDEIINKLHLPFQLLTAKMATVFLTLIHIPVLREGTILQLPGQTLEVAPGCSGVSFLVAVIALGIPLVYLTQPNWRRAGAVIVSGVLIAVLTNWIRVAIAGIMAIRYGSGLVHGPAHIFQGWLVSQVGLVGLFLTNWGVGKIIPSACKLSLFEKTMNAIPVSIQSKHGNHSITSVIVLSFFLIGFSFYQSIFGKPIPVPLITELMIRNPPLEGWSMKKSDWIASSKYFPGADNEYSCSFLDPAGNCINAYIGYFSIQRQGKSLISYLSRALLTNSKIVQLDTFGGGKKDFNLSYPRIDGIPHIALLWYRFPDKDTAGRYETKLTGIINAVFKRRNNGSVILLATPLRNHEDPMVVEKKLFRFAVNLDLNLPNTH